MIDYQRIFHTGIRVADLERSMAELGGPLGVTWATVQQHSAQPVWTPDRGLETVQLTFVYSRAGPQHIELLEGSPGSIWDGRDRPGVHHVGLWVDDVAAEIERCLDAGWSVAAAAAEPGDGYGPFAYVVPPSGPILELVWSAIEPRFRAWWDGGSLGGERAV